MNDNFKTNLEHLGIELNEEQMEKFATYYQMLIDWNKKVNLTSILEKSEVYSKHFIDSLWLSKVADLKTQLILDVGSGAGFPSIPLKIVFPNLKITIIDSLKKRITFLKDLVETLGIDVNLIHGRIEDFPKKNHYDIVTARAVASLDILSEFCIPFVKKGGLFLPMKGSVLDEELAISHKAIQLMGGDLIDIFSYSYNDIKRTIPIIIKNRITPSIYPRALAKIKKKPIR